ncbi:MAG: helix-turn-helix transcriptional regulator [Clostridia bacterium]|nr:helix-turn-helix transcriptional regulator [Clostridia bacterium]
MKTGNICKFPETALSNELSIFSFVFETDESIMKKETRLNKNRMILIEQGTGELLFDGVPYSVATGTLIFGFEGETYVLRNGEGVRYLYIDFGGARASGLFCRFGIFLGTRKKDNLNALIPLCKESLFSTQQENIDITAESIVLYAFSRISTEHTAKQSDIMQKIIEYTEENFRDPELSISSVADEIGYNPKYLSHLFKKKMNVSYCEYLRSLRFKHAISLFELGLSSVKNVAFMSGFSDPLYFSNAFKKAIGISPKDFITGLSVDKGEEKQTT